MNTRKIAIPHEYRITPDFSGAFIYWQHRQEEGMEVYKRLFSTPNEIEVYAADIWGARFARKVRQAAEVVFATLAQNN